MHTALKLIYSDMAYMHIMKTSPASVVDMMRAEYPVPPAPTADRVIPRFVYTYIDSYLDSHT